MSELKWPELNFPDLKETLTTVQLWSQIVGKIRMTKMPWLNHAWNAALYVCPQGLTTSAIPYENGNFEIILDFKAHQLRMICSNGTEESFSLENISVATFYRQIKEKLQHLGITINIVAKPNEVDPAIPFAKDEEHNTYVKEQINSFFTALTKMLPVFQDFKAGFTGKSSPVHFFWGGFDLAVSRFSGRKAPLHQGEVPNMPAKIMQESYSHEVCSAGFWPGGDYYPEPIFYSYCYPDPAGYKGKKVQPAEAKYQPELGEFVLSYKDVATAEDPEKTLMTFFQSTYDAAADTANWDKESLEFSFFKNES